MLTLALSPTASILSTGPLLWAQDGDAASQAPQVEHQLRDEIIMVGNSIQLWGIDFRQLSSMVGIPVRSVARSSAMSAFKFVLLYQEAAMRPPKYAIIVTRLNYITRHDLSVQNKPLEADRLMNEVAGNEELERLVKERAYAEITPEEERWNFDQLVESSFLPLMIETARKAGIQLIVVRHRSRAEADGRTNGVVRYTAEMANYLKGHGVHFLDYSHLTELTPEHYALGDHLNRGEGRAIWTRALAADLNKLLADPSKIHIILHNDERAAARVEGAVW